MSGRKRLSGAAYKKLALSKEAKNTAIIKKCGNIGEMFKAKNPCKSCMYLKS